MIPLMSSAALVRIGRRRGTSWKSGPIHDSDYLSVFDDGFDAWCNSWDFGGSCSCMGEAESPWFLSEPR